MKNRGAALTARPIPYHKAYKEFCGSVLATILFQQLEYWTNTWGDGFYKALEPCENYAWYRAGDSWTEELGFSLFEFRNAFSRIGIAYVSKKQHDSSGLWRFKREDGSEALYLSYIDRPRGKTFYFRNHTRVAQLLLEVEEVMFPVDSLSQSTGNLVSVDSLSQSPGDSLSQSPGDAVSQSPGDAVSQSPHHAETTTESTTKNIPLNPPLGPARFSTQHGAANVTAGAGQTGAGKISGQKRKRSKLWLAIASGCGIHPKISSQALQIEISRVEAELVRLLGAAVKESQLLEYCSWVEQYWKQCDWRGSRLRDQKLQPRMYIDLYGVVIQWKKIG